MGRAKLLGSLGEHHEGLHNETTYKEMALLIYKNHIDPLLFHSFFRGGGGYGRQEADLNICTTAYNQIYNWEMEK